MEKLLIYTTDACLEHRPGPSHPERPERLTAVRKALKAPEFKGIPWKDSPLGTREQLLLIHTPEYVDRISRLRPKSGYVPLDGGDTVMSPGTWDAVVGCVGAACAAVDEVVSGAYQRVFCATRPCGHHAEADRAMGFCVFNQAAVAVAYASKKHRVPRVGIVDFDVHHGNGTQAAFYFRPEIFYGSCHQSPFYPGTGAKHETGVDNNVVNVPLPRGCSSEVFRARMQSEMLPALQRFEPALLLISAGFDAHQRDSLGGLNLTDDDFYWITKELVSIANHCCEGKIVSILEGGYSLDGLATGSAAHVRALMED
ncbi:MAG: histone deacetylase family protein [Burkholderiaceae bacterium]|jgi:acetoin utilization deacetylase AcuC-like enzyme|nr:histone deacetylase family protein [Burkholderiaceae bacterium]